MPMNARLIAALLAALALAGPAHAFTLQNSDGTTTDMSAGYSSSSPEKKRFESATTKDGTTTLNLGGGSTMQFGAPQSWGPDYSGHQQRMFNPLRPGN